jgi:hypothetical protein
MYHTWYGRLYEKSKLHTDRINNVIEIRNKINNNKSSYIKPIVYKDKSFKKSVEKNNFFKIIEKKIKKVIKTFFFNE